MLKDFFFHLLFITGKLIKNTVGLLRACFFCHEHIVLAIVLGALYLSGYVYSRGVLASTNSWGWALDHMFDLAITKQSVMNGCVSEKIFSIVLYCVTWLIGGGTLLAALVSRSGAFFAKIQNGEIRYSWCLRGHHVILGWDYNVISLLRQKELCRKQIVIISELPTAEIRKTILAAGGVGRFARLPSNLLIYRGEYDSKLAFKKLCLKYAARIYITGVQQERAHDIRTLILLSHLDKYFGECNRERLSPIRIPCSVRIQSHYLYRLLILNIKKGPNSFQHLNKDDVRFFNFYENWARRLWDENTRERNKGKGKAYPVLRYSPANNKIPIRLVVVGFGQMGQALVVQALRQAKEPSRNGNTDCVKTNITIIDPNAHELYEYFLQNYADIVTGYMKDANCKIDEVLDMSAHSMVFKQRLAEQGYPNEQLTVAITLPDADDALNTAMMINGVMQQRVNILVRANIYNSDIEQCREDLCKCYDLKNIYFFGFKDGAGFKR